MHRPAVSAPLPGLFITSLPRRQCCGSGAAANNQQRRGPWQGGFCLTVRGRERRENTHEEGESLCLITWPSNPARRFQQTSFMVCKHMTDGRSPEVLLSDSCCAVELYIRFFSYCKTKGSHTLTHLVSPLVLK